MSHKARRKPPGKRSGLCSRWDEEPNLMEESNQLRHARGAFEAMMEMGKIDVAKIDAARRG